MEGDLASDFVLFTPDGQRVSLRSFEGKPVFLNFWATWCGSCKMEMPDMELLQKSLGEKIEILGVNQGESPAHVEAFVRDNGYSWTFLADADQEVGNLYRVSGYPTSVFINAEGRITGRRVGMMTGEDMERQIRIALGKSDESFRHKVTRIATSLKKADTGFKSIELSSNVASMNFALKDGRGYQINIFDREDEAFQEGLLDFQVPSYDLREAPISDLESYLLNWNLDYAAGAWAVDNHNNRLTLVAKYGGKMVEPEFLASVCTKMIGAVAEFEKIIDKLMEDAKR